LHRTQQNRADTHTNTRVKTFFPHPKKHFHCPLLTSETMEGYGLSEEDLFSSSLHNFTWENSFEQTGRTSVSSSLQFFPHWLPPNPYHEQPQMFPPETPSSLPLLSNACLNIFCSYVFASALGVDDIITIIIMYHGCHQYFFIYIYIYI
ncbi:hypothetical protein MHYP_G00009200, partial [Metynnis hypsauchen]